MYLNVSSIIKNFVVFIRFKIFMTKIFILFLLLSCEKEDIYNYASDLSDSCTITGIDAGECIDIQSECSDLDGFYELHEPNAEYFCSCNC